MDPKLLTENGWKTVALKFKVKDNGLQKALAVYEKLPDDKFDEQLKAVAAVSLLAGNLQKVKEVAANRDVDKYLDAVLAAAKAAPGEIKNAKALAEKKATETKKLELKAQEAEEEGDEDDEEETGDSFTKLTTALKNVKLSKKPYFFLVCDAKPYGLMISKKDIRKNAQARKELAQMAGGSTRPPKVGECRFENGKHVFEMEKPPSGLARILQKWIKDSTGLGVKVMVGTESAEDEEQPAGSAPGKPADGGPSDAGAEKAAQRPAAAGVGAAATATTAPPKPPQRAGGGLALGAPVGRGGKNVPADVQVVQEALNRRKNAGLSVNGKCDAKTISAIEDFQKALGQFKPDGLIEPGRGTARALAGTGKLPPPPAPPKPIAPPKLGKPALAKAPEIWHGMRKILDTNVGELKKAVLAQYGTEHADLLQEIDENLVKLDVVVEKLDTKLADSLAKANAAKNDAARNAELKNAKAILADYIKFVKSEPLIGHIDSNPFGVATNLKTIITGHLTHMAQSTG